jgi:non-specific serine/threonine protein kinase
MAALALAANGRAALHRHDIDRATTQFCEGLRLGADAGFAIGLAYNLEGVAIVCTERNQPERAARLLGAAEAAYALLDVPGLVPYSSLANRAHVALRTSLGHNDFAAAQAAGRGLPTEDAIALASSVAFEAKAVGHRRHAAEDGLTPREIEVLRLLAAGHSNPEIATALVISTKTVERHLANVYAKVGARSRVEAATYALTRGFYMNTRI